MPTPTVLSQAAGRVVTGYSTPVVALYTVNDGSVVYSNPKTLARGVSVEVNPESSDATIFYADNIAAETAPGRFTGGEVTLTVDGLNPDAEKMIMGLPDPSADGFTYYNDDQSIPYVGVGWITRYMSGNVTFYVPEGLCKVAFNPIDRSAETQEEEIDFQTQELTANIMRDDSAKHAWRFFGSDYSTEADAATALRSLLAGTH